MNQGSLKLSHQTMYVASGGNAMGITVASGGYIAVDGRAMGIDVREYGSMNIFRGSAADIVVNGGKINISSGGTLTGTVINGGSVCIINGKCSSLELNGGTINVGFSSGHRNEIKGSADTVNVRNGGIVNVSSGGKTVNTNLYSGTLNISSGGETSNNTIRNGGQMIISSSGKASDSNITSGGIMTIAYGGSHYGRLNIAQGGRVIAESNSNICISITGKTANKEYFISDFALIEGTPSYTVQASSKQSSGVYKLGGNAQNIQYINISVDGKYYFAEVNSDGFFVGSKYYLLQRTAENALHLTIAATPSKPKISSSNTKLTNQNITLTAVGQKDTRCQYSFDGELWHDYTAEITVEENGTYYFRSVNEYNLYSPITAFTVKNIDKEAPMQTFDITAHPKNINALVKVSSADASGIASIQYRFSNDENTPWLTYSKTKGIKVTENGTLYIKSTDKAGNTVIDFRTFEFDTLPANNWTDLKNAGANSAELGHADIAGISGWVGIDDAIDYYEITLDEAGKYSFDINSSDKTNFTIYKLNSKTNRTGVVSYSLKSLQSTTLKYDKNNLYYSAETKGLLLEEGTYYIAVKSTNAAKGGNADYSVSVSNNTIYFPESKNGKNDDWQDMKNAGANSDFIGEINCDNDGKIIDSGWVGFGDAVDYKKLTIDETTKFSLAVNAEDKAKITIYKLVEKKDGSYKLQSVKSSTLAKQKYFYLAPVTPIEPVYGIPRDPTLPPPVISSSFTEIPENNFYQYSSFIDNLILEEGTYYIAMQSTNAAKGGNAAYEINETASETVQQQFISDTDDTWKKAKENQSFACGDVINDWVGYGDTKDFFKIELTENGKLRFSAAEDPQTFYDTETLDALYNKEIKISCVNEKGKTVALQYDGFDYTSKKELSAGTYYVCVKSANAKKYWTEYNIAIEQI